MKIKSAFAILDVTKGWHKLMENYGPSGSHPRIPVTIEGYITGFIHGDDDGLSREFIVEVKSVTTGKPEAHT